MRLVTRKVSLSSITLLNSHVLAECPFRGLSRTHARRRNTTTTQCCRRKPTRLPGAGRVHRWNSLENASRRESWLATRESNNEISERAAGKSDENDGTRTRERQEKCGNDSRSREGCRLPPWHWQWPSRLATPNAKLSTRRRQPAPHHRAPLFH